eukprot:365443-Chlamydomonas_euryale.AAC.33
MYNANLCTRPHIHTSATAPSSRTSLSVRGRRSTQSPDPHATPPNLPPLTGPDASSTAPSSCSSLSVRGRQSTQSVVRDLGLPVPGWRSDKRSRRRNHAKPAPVRICTPLCENAFHSHFIPTLWIVDPYAAWDAAAAWVKAEGEVWVRDEGVGMGEGRRSLDGRGMKESGWARDEGVGMGEG